MFGAARLFTFRHATICPGKVFVCCEVKQNAIEQLLATIVCVFLHPKKQNKASVK